jgi:hypothetical protein
MGHMDSIFRARRIRYWSARRRRLLSALEKLLRCCGRFLTFESSAFSEKRARGSRLKTFSLHRLEFLLARFNGSK